MRNLEKNVDNILWGKQLWYGERESRRYPAYIPLGAGQSCPGFGVGGRAWFCFFLFLPPILAHGLFPNYKRGLSAKLYFTNILKCMVWL